MFPFPRVDLTKFSYAAVFDITLPLLPGGTVALLWLYGHQEVWNSFRDDLALKCVVSLFIMYVLGFVIWYLSAFEVIPVALIILMRRIQPSEPWKNIEWRRIAASSLAQNYLLPSKSLKHRFASNFQSRWQTWYGILQAYFPLKKDPQQVLGTIYCSVFLAIGWAGLIGSYISHRHVNWLLWVVCFLVICVSHVYFTTMLSLQNNPDPSGNQLSAEILKAIKGP